MNFASAQFILLFLPVTLALFHGIRGPNAGQWRMAVIIAASAVFYAASGWRNVLVLAGSVSANYAIGRILVAIPRERKDLRKPLMWLGVLGNIALLLGFKLHLLAAQGGRGFNAAEDIMLPLALSFITFQKIGFVASCYRGTIREVKPGHYLFFVLFYPQLVLGPIARFEEIDKQLRDNALARVDPRWVATGIAVFCLALVKKLVIADRLGLQTDAIFSAAASAPIGFLDAWFAAITFQLQLFFDFTVYGEMAIGLAMMVGMKVPLNFDRPFFARDRAETWRRWHISFATFIRTNVFLPLARHWKWPIPAALAVTGILSGLWHGLGVTFVIWGLTQTAILLWLHFRNDRRRRAGRKGLPAPLAIAVTFAVSCLLGAMFRSPDLTVAGHLYGGLAGFNGLHGPFEMNYGKRHIAFAVLAALLIWGGPDFGQLFRGQWRYTELRQGVTPPPRHWTEGWLRYAPGPLWGLISALALLAGLAMLAVQIGIHRFVYVQF